MFGPKFGPSINPVPNRFAWVQRLCCGWIQGWSWAINFTSRLNRPLISWRRNPRAMRQTSRRCRFRGWTVFAAPAAVGRVASALPGSASGESHNVRTLQEGDVVDATGASRKRMRLPGACYCVALASRLAVVGSCLRRLMSNRNSPALPPQLWGPHARRATRRGGD